MCGAVSLYLEVTFKWLNQKSINEYKRDRGKKNTMYKFSVCAQQMLNRERERREREQM